MEMLENLKMAFSALMGNKLRSGLTMLGIAIGNASVIALVGVGEGAQKVAIEQFEALGPNVLFVSTSSRNVRRTIPNPRPLTYEDAQAIASQVPAIAAISPELSGKKILSFGNRTSNSPLIGVGAEYLNVRNRQLSKGRFIMESDLKRDNRVIVKISLVIAIPSAKIFASAILVFKSLEFYRRKAPYLRLIRTIEL
jgi:putative ABC transport system permease protein